VMMHVITKRTSREPSRAMAKGDGQALGQLIWGAVAVCLEWRETADVRLESTK
jgi:hypothetical protein